MDLSKATNEQKLNLCGWYYKLGFAFLPFLWFINVIWFFPWAFWQKPFDEQKQIRSYVIRSAIGSILWTSGLIAWIVVFQQNRAEWGATADSMSFIIPLGKS